MFDYLRPRKTSYLIDLPASEHFSHYCRKCASLKFWLHQSVYFFDSAGHWACPRSNPLHLAALIDCLCEYLLNACSLFPQTHCSQLLQIADAEVSLGSQSSFGLSREGPELRLAF